MFFYIMVQTVKIDIGKKLAGQIADGDAAPPLQRRQQIITRIILHIFFLWIARINDQPNQPEGVRAFNFTRNPSKENFMVNG